MVFFLKKKTQLIVIGGGHKRETNNCVLFLNLTSQINTSPISKLSTFYVRAINLFACTRFQLAYIRFQLAINRKFLCTTEYKRFPSQPPASVKMLFTNKFLFKSGNH